MALIIGLFFPLGFPQMALNTVIGERQRELRPTLLHQAMAGAQVSVTSLGETTRGELKNLHTLKNEFIPLSD